MIRVWDDEGVNADRSLLRPDHGLHDPPRRDPGDGGVPGEIAEEPSTSGTQCFDSHTGWIQRIGSPVSMLIAPPTTGWSSLSSSIIF